MQSVAIAFAAPRLSPTPKVMSLSLRSGSPMVTMAAPSAGGVPAEVHGSGNGRSQRQPPDRPGARRRRARVGGDDTRRHFPFAGELHFGRRRGADAALIGDDEPLGIDEKPRRAACSPSRCRRRCPAICSRRKPLSDSGAAPGAPSDGPAPSVLSALAAVRLEDRVAPAAMSRSAATRSGGRGTRAACRTRWCSCRAGASPPPSRRGR